MAHIVLRARIPADSANTSKLALGSKTVVSDLARDESPALRLRGLEGSKPKLEDVANYLRDLVFLHDRLLLWTLGYRQEAEGYRYSFFSRYSRRDISGLGLRVKSLHLGSPWETVLILAGIGVAPAAINAFVALIRQLAMTGPERAHLQAQAGEARARAALTRTKNQMLNRLYREIERDPEDLGFSSRAAHLLRRDGERLVNGAVLLDEVEEVDLVEEGDELLDEDDNHPA